MKKKKLLLVLLAGLMAAGCVNNRQQPASSSAPVSQETSETIQSISNAEFRNFLDQYVIKACENDYTLAHRYFEHPENYGIDISKCKVTLGSILPTDEDLHFQHQILSNLEKMDDKDLNQTNQQIRQQMMWESRLILDSSDEKFAYLDNIWSEISGVTSVLTDFFSEYQLYSQADIEPLLTLIQDVPRYVDEAIAYSKRQAELKTLAVNMDSLRESCQSILETRDDSPVTNELLAEIDGLNLDAAAAASWKEKITADLNEHFFPSFEKALSALEDLEDQNGQIKGLASYKDGKEYYKYVVANYAGTDADIETIKEEIRTAMDDSVVEYRQILREDPESATLGEPETSFKDISEIMPFLEERYPADFPIVKTMDYEIKPLSAEQSKQGVMAYFVLQPIDSTRPYEIRYNARDYGSDPNSLQLYNTFAHEGIPGHMYQAQYEREHFKHPAQYFLSAFGMQEGYATYAAYETLDWTGINENDLEVWKLTDQYSNYSVLLMDLQINYDGYSLSEFENVWGEGSEAVYNQLAENPGVFFGYYYGSLKIFQLQQIAKDALGSLYDPVEFNNALLQMGNVEFSIIEDNIQAYIDAKRNSSYGKNASETPSEKSTESQEEAESQEETDSQQESSAPSSEMDFFED